MECVGSLIQMHVRLKQADTCIHRTGTEPPENTSEKIDGYRYSFDYFFE